MTPRPLTDRRILVGRALHQASALSSGLRKLGAEILEIPFIEIRKPRSYAPLDASLKNIRDYDWLVLTSVNGVEAFWQRAKKRGVTRSKLRHLEIAAIGPATKQAIKKKGLKVRVVPEQYIAESVVDSLRDQVKGKRVLLARAKVARDVIPTELRKLGAKVDVVEAYETIVPKSSKARLQAAFSDPSRRPDAIAFTSSSTAKNFLALLGRRNQLAGKGIQFASIGPVTSATLRELHFPVDIEAKRYDIPGLIQAITVMLSGT